jgi:tetratricopeptide (TPR) repeat protein
MAMEKKIPGSMSLLAWGVCIFLLLSLGLSFAQESVAEGIVTDEQGKAIKNARLTLLNPATGLKFALKTDKDGKFMKVGIPAATYKVTVEAEGFLTLESLFTIRFGMRENLEIKLKKSVSPTDKNMTEGSDLFRAGKYDQAIESFKGVVEKYPANYEGYFNLGLSYMKKKETDSAITALEKAAELNPQSLDAVFALGESYFVKGNIEKALQSFSRAIELKPESYTAHYDLGLAYYKLNKNEEALAQFDKAIELKPNGASGYYQAGLAAIRLESSDRAIKYFEGFLKLEPDAPEAAQVRTMIDELRKRIK